MSILTYVVHIYSTQRSRVLEKLTGSQLVKKFPALYGTQRFITAFTSARQLSLSSASSIQFIPSHLISWRSILILSSHLCLALPNGLFLSGFPTKTLYTPLLTPIYAMCPAHLVLNFITQTVMGEDYRSLSSLYIFLHSRTPTVVIHKCVWGSNYSFTEHDYICMNLRCAHSFSI